MIPTVKKDPKSLRQRAFTFLKDHGNATLDDIVKAFPGENRQLLTTYRYRFNVMNNRKTTDDSIGEKIMEAVIPVENETSIATISKDRTRNAEPAKIIERGSILEEEFVKRLHVVEDVDPLILEDVIPERIIDVFKITDTRIFKVENKYIKTARCPGCRSVLATLDVTREVNLVLEKRKKDVKNVDHP